MSAVDKKLTDLATASTFDAGSWFLLVDPTVTTMDAGGTDLKVQAGNLIKGLLPSQTGNAGQFLTTDGTSLSWEEVSAGGGGIGTVTSVAVTVPSWLSVSGSPITGSGTIAISSGTVAANRVLASPDGSSGALTARALLASDIPNLPASQITAGTMATARLGSGTANGTKYLAGDSTWQTLNQGAVSGLATSDSPTFAGATIGTLTGLVKATTGVLSAATAGTDYLTGSFAGSSSIVTVGTIGSGTWQGTTIAVANGGTGQTSASAAINALVPTQTSNSGKVLGTNGTSVSWVSVGGTGTVTSVDLTVPSWLTVTGNPVTTSGTLAVAATTGQAANSVLATPDGSTGTVSLRVLAAGDIPSLNASKITAGTMATARLGSGTANSTKYLAGDSTWGTLNQAAVAGLTTADSPTFAGATLGTLAGVLKATTGVVSAATAGTDYVSPSGTWVGNSSITTLGTVTTGTWSATTIAINKGGTGQTTAANAINALLPTQTSNSGKFLTTDGSVASWGTAGSGSGTVTTVSVASANGFAGSVANATTTPAITISTSVTGLLKGDGTAISAATAGTDYATLMTPTAVKTTAYSAAAGDFVPCDSTSAGFAVTLPTAPADKTVIGVKHVTQGSTNNVTVVTGGSDVFNKAGGVTTLNLSSSSRGVTLQYKASGAIWYVVARDIGAVLSADVPTMVASGASHAPGVVPDPPSSSGSTKFLREDATWAIPAGGTATPGGSDTQVQYNSSGSFAGAANFAIPSSGTLRGTAITDPVSPNSGDLWNSSTRPGWTIIRGGLPARLGGTIWQLTAATTAVANTTSETSLLSGGTSAGSLTIPANSLAVGDVIRFGFSGTLGTTGTPTGNFSMYLGATKFATSGAVAASAAISGGLWFDIYRCEYVILAIGGTGKILGTGCVLAAKNAGGSLQNYVPSGGSAGAQAPTQVTIDTTGSLTFDARYTWGTASASNTCQILTAYLSING